MHRKNNTNEKLGLIQKLAQDLKAAVSEALNNTTRIKIPGAQDEAIPTDDNVIPPGYNDIIILVKVEGHKPVRYQP